MSGYEIRLVFNTPNVAGPGSAPNPIHPIPHTFVQVRQPNGAIIEYGFAPRDDLMGAFGGIGKVAITGTGTPDGPHAGTAYGDWTSITSDQNQSLINFVNETQASGARYQTFGGDLATGVKDVIATEGSRLQAQMESYIFRNSSAYGMAESSPSYNCVTWQENLFQRMGLSDRYNAWTNMPWEQEFRVNFDKFRRAAVDGFKRWVDRWKKTFQDIGDDVSDAYNWAKRWRPRFDPLALDLDGDGVEVTGATFATLFDHDRSGVRFGTGWIASDDGLLVLDRNGNGLVDNGFELFGDASPGGPLPIGREEDSAQPSAGFRSLQKLDSNGDGVFDATDATFALVRVWRDLNQDGVSQAGELFSLQDVNIQSINLTPTSTADVSLNNENSILTSGSFVRTDGTTGSMADLALASNPFYREFTTRVSLTEGAKLLPNLRGSGMVRDLQEAASVNDRLVQSVGTLRDGMSRDAMYAKIDKIIDDWASTSTFQTSEDKLALLAVPLSIYAQNGNGELLNHMVKMLEIFNGSNFFELRSPNTLAVGTVNYQSSPPPADGTSSGVIGVSREFKIVLPQAQADFLKQSYDALKESIYRGLVFHTRLKSYASDLSLIFDGTGFSVDTTNLLARLQAAFDADNKTGLQNLIDFLRYGRDILGDASDSLQQKVEVWATILSGTEQGKATLASVGITLSSTNFSLPTQGAIVIGTLGNDAIYGQAGDDVISTGDGNDTLYGGQGRDLLDGGAGDDYLDAGEDDDVLNGRSGNDTLYGQAGHDTLHGGEGNDRLYGGDGHDVLTGDAGDDFLQGDAGNDLLFGGQGNDTLSGGTGDNMYVFNRGDGNDVVQASYDIAATKSNTLLLGAGITAADVSFKRVYDSTLGGDGALQIIIANPSGATDTITFNGFLYNDDPASAYNGLQAIQFADGTAWNLNDITTKLFSVVDGSIRGTIGDDVLNGNDADNVLNGLAGNDTLEGGAGNDQLFGGVGNDILLGGAGNDALDGGAGDDLMEGGAGNDNYNGGTGNNTYVFGRGDGKDVISSTFDDAQTKANVIRFKSGIAAQDVTVRQVINNAYWSSGRDLVLSVGDGADSITVKGFFNNDDTANSNNPVQGIEFADGTHWSIADLLAKIYAGTSADDVLYGTVQGDSIFGGAGKDRLYGGQGADQLSGGDDDDQLYGEAGNDTLLGGAGNDMLDGGDGDDVLDGGAGNDVLNGGVGNNTYRFGRGDGQDTINANWDSTAGKVNTIAFKAGVDPQDIVIKQLSALNSADLEVSIAGSSDKIIIRGFANNDDPSNAANPVQQFTFANGTVWNLDGIKARLFAGTAGDDVIRGTVAGDTINGGAGNDTLSGGFGNDTLIGGAGNDWLDGQQDDDTLLGGDGDDYLHGCDGNDILDGGAGNDRLIGNAGNNTYRFGRGDGADIVLANDAGAGTFNTLELKAGITAADITLKQVGEDGQGNGMTALQVMLNGSSDTFTLNSFFQSDDFANVANPVQQIRFSDGTVWDMATILSRLFAGTVGDDVIRGTLNADTIHGGAGNDHILGAAAADSLYGDAGNDTLEGGEGNDQLFGGAGNDLLDGGTGADVMDGGTGDDIYLVDDVGDQVIEAADAGLDIIRSSVSYTLPAGVERLELVGNDAINATGSARADTLIGNGASNRLEGLAGDDVLDGGYGADTLVGGAGNDTYMVDQSDDVVIELANEGIDTVNSSANEYTLSANVERLVLLNGGWKGVGNELDNELIGNDNANLLDGGAGNDRMVGGLGNDTYVVDSASDVVVENAGEGNDTVLSSISYTLGATVENLTLTGTANINATGNAGDNTILGNAGNNRIDGGAGNDQMAGGAGDDYYIVDSAQLSNGSFTGDWVTENANEGIDTIERTCETNLLLADNVENLVLSGNARTGHGNNLDNVITGNAANNSSSGMGGDDTIYGLGGDDQLFGDAGNDKLYGGDGNDYLEGGTGNDRLEGGNGNDQLGGGAGTDSLIGGAGDDSYVLTLDGSTDVIDNTGGGFDGVFFASPNITKERLGFKRDGNDLLIIVDNNDAAPAARVVNHFLGGDWAIDFVQPSAQGSYYLTTAEINAKVAAYGTGYDTVMDGTEVADTGNTALVGSAGKDWIRGLGGDDQIFGNSGDDLIQGGIGNDYLCGGLGNDTNTGNDRLEGGDGNDTLVGQDGDDMLIGGAGNDTYMWDAGLDTIDNTGGGTDTLFFPNTIALTRLTFKQDGNDLLILVDNNPAQGVRVVKHFLGGDYALDYVYQNGGTGYTTAQMNQKAAMAGYDNVVQGTANADTLNGTAGKDLMYGGAGNDIMNGGAGDDRLLGEAGNDTLYGGAGKDRLEGGLGDDTYTIDDALDLVIENVNEGNDLVNASISYVLPDNVERLTLTGTTAINGTGNALDNLLTGNSAANTLTGGAGNDTLDGGAGNDTLIGELGDDTYIVDATGDVVTEAANEGIDTVKSSVTFTLGANVENLTLTGTNVINGTGNALDNVLIGNSANNTLTGGAGNDTLDGGAGTDTMIGGLGNDTYIVDATTDVVTEAVNEGIDTVQSKVTYTLGNNVENLTLTGTTAINGTGNALDNVLTGNSGVNSLTGNAGNDTLDGGAGADTLTGGTGNDTYVMGRGYGADMVVENDTTAGNLDVAKFLTGIAFDQLWFEKPTGTNDLKISIIGTTDTMTIKSWFLGSQYQVEEIRTVDGSKVLAAAKVQTLVTKMASMAKPTTTTLTAAQHTALDPTLAATWTTSSAPFARSMTMSAGGNLFQAQVMPMQESVVADPLIAESNVAAMDEGLPLGWFEGDIRHDFGRSWKMFDLERAHRAEGRWDGLNDSREPSLPSGAFTSELDTLLAAISTFDTGSEAARSEHEIKPMSDILSRQFHVQHQLDRFHALN